MAVDSQLTVASAPPRPRFVPVPHFPEGDDDYVVKLRGRDGETISAFALTPDQDAAVGLTREQVRVVYAAERQARNDLRSETRWQARDWWVDGLVYTHELFPTQPSISWSARAMGQRAPRARRVAPRARARSPGSRSDGDPEPHDLVVCGGAA